MSNIKTFSFPGGVPIHQGEELSNNSEIQTAPLLDSYMVNIAQNIGAPPKPIVKKGDEVKKGQLIAECAGFVSANLHSPTSGKIKAIEIEYIEIGSDGEDSWGSPYEPITDWENSDVNDLKQRIGDCGIVGMGGAGFPTFVKLSPPPTAKMEFVIINAAECEPYLTADNRLMLEEPEKLLTGAAICAKILDVKNVIIGIEDNKPEAIALLKERATKYNIDIVALPVRYPQGSEKHLIYALTGRKVSCGALPSATGCLVQNVGTAVAITEAICEGKPLIERITTVTGECVVNPGNWKFRLGTTFEKAIELSGGVKYNPIKILAGGPMMGNAQKSLDGKICKNTSGVLLLGPEFVSQYRSDPCIRCGKCVAACPMNLMPGTLSMAIDSENYDLIEDLHVMDCIECGSCSFVCPAYRPLVQHFRRGKLEVRNMK